MITTQPSDEIRIAAEAIANARGNRRGVPTIIGILDALPKKLAEEVLEDAAAALEAVAELRRQKAKAVLANMIEAKRQGMDVDPVSHLIALKDAGE